MGLQKRLSQVGFAKQSGKGAAAATATFLTGVTGGSLVTVDVSEEELNSSWTTRVLENFDRVSVVPGLDMEGILTSKLAGLLLYGACGAIGTTGAGPYTHTITPFDDLPYLTLFTNYASLYNRVDDAKIDELEIAFDKAGGLTYKAKAVGTTLTALASVFTSTNSERPTAGVFKGAGGIFSIEGVTGQKIKSGSIKVKNNVEPVLLANAVTPDDVFPGMVACDVSLTLVVNDLNYFKKVILGGTGNTTISSGVYTGALQLKFILDANTDLQFDVQKARLMTSFPDADPSGGPAEVQIEASVIAPASGAPFTFVVKNAQASY